MATAERLLKKILDTMAPNIEPCGTPYTNIFHELNELLIIVCYHLFYK